MSELSLICAGAPALTLEIQVGSPQVQTLLDALPQSGTMLHSRRSGREIFLPLSPQLPDEWGATTCRSTLEPGEIVACGFPAQYRDAPPDTILPGGIAYTHLGIAYDDGARFATAEGYLDVGVLGRVTSSLAELRQLGEAMRSAGARSFTLTPTRNSS